MRIGVVGGGEISRKMHLPVLLSIPDVSVAWVYDRDPARSTALAKAYRVSSVADWSASAAPPVDVVLLAIPVEFRAEYLAEFAARGVAVLCEKPFALSAREHEAVVAMYADARLGCAYMRRFYHWVRLLERVCDAGWFGTLRRVRVLEGGRTRGSGVDGSFLDDPKLGRSKGVLTDLGSHGLDVILRLVRPEHVDVLACEMVLDGNVDRRVAAQLSLSPARVGPAVEVEFCVSWLDPQPNRIELEFEHATLWANLAPDADVYIGVPGHASRSIRLDADVGGARNANQAFFLEWVAFLAGVRSGTESEVSARKALATTALVQSLYDRGAAAVA